MSGEAFRKLLWAEDNDIARTLSSDPSVGTLGRTQAEVKQIESNLRDGELDSVLRNLNATGISHRAESANRCVS